MRSAIPQRRVPQGAASLREKKGNQNKLSGAPLSPSQPIVMLETVQEKVPDTGIKMFDEGKRFPQAVPADTYFETQTRAYDVGGQAQGDYLVDGYDFAPIKIKIEKNNPQLYSAQSSESSDMQLPRVAEWQPTVQASQNQDEQKQYYQSEPKAVFQMQSDALEFQAEPVDGLRLRKQMEGQPTAAAVSRQPTADLRELKIMQSSSSPSNYRNNNLNAAKSYIQKLQERQQRALKGATSKKQAAQITKDFNALFKNTDKTVKAANDAKYDLMSSMDISTISNKGIKRGMTKQQELIKQINRNLPVNDRIDI